MSADLQRVLAYAERAPLAGWLGYSAVVSGGGLIHRLAFEEQHIGNPAIRAIHGGVIAAFLEFSMQAELHALTGAAVSTVNIAVDYVASSTAEDVTAIVEIEKQGRRVSFLDARGYQQNVTRLVATARACLKIA